MACEAMYVPPGASLPETSLGGRRGRMRLLVLKEETIRFPFLSPNLKSSLLVRFEIEHCILLLFLYILLLLHIYVYSLKIHVFMRFIKQSQPSASCPTHSYLQLLLPRAHHYDFSCAPGICSNHSK